MVLFQAESGDSEQRTHTTDSLAGTHVVVLFKSFFELWATNQARSGGRQYRGGFLRALHYYIRPTRHPNTVFVCNTFQRCRRTQNTFCGSRVWIKILQVQLIGSRLRSCILHRTPTRLGNEGQNSLRRR